MKLMKGTARPDRMRGEEERPAADLTLDTAPPPDWLTNADAIAEWRDKVEMLRKLGKLIPAKLTMLGHFCALHGALLVKWRAGMTPSAAEMRELRTLATDLGLNEGSGSEGSSRSKEPDPWSDLAKGPRRG
jgi:phage terminase small subunit